MKERKEALCEVLKLVKLIDDTFTGEITIGINSGGVTFIRRSETLK